MLLLLFSVFAGLALLLACIGIYGVLAYLTSQRVPEIGVRMALGATRSDVILLILRQSMGMIFAGVGVGIARGSRRRPSTGKIRGRSEVDGAADIRRDGLRV